MKAKIYLFLISFTFVFSAMTGFCLAQADKYIYDDLNRLVKAEYSDGSIIEYTYDELGNRLSQRTVSGVPAAVNDNYTVEESGSINQFAPGVLVNDINIQGKSAVAILLTGVSHGSLVLNPDGSFVYTHDGSETAGDSFTYKVNDGKSDSNIAAVNIVVNPVNDAPTAVNKNVELNEDNSLEIILNGSDVDSSSLTYTIMTLPSRGALLRTAADKVTYTPVFNYSGSDSFTFKVNDGQLDSNIAAVNITVKPINDPPCFAVLNSKTINEGQLLEFTVTAVDPDPQDTLTLGAANLPEGASFNPGTGVFNWTPNYEQAGTYTGIKFTVSDGVLTDSEGITITVNDVDITPPVTIANYDGVWHNEDFVIYLSASDSQTGVKETFYKINSASECLLSVSGQPVISNEGNNNTLEYWSIDKAGNQETHYSLTGIKLDKTFPAITIISPCQEAVFENNPITVSGTIEDTLSGVEIVTVTIGETTQNALINGNSFTVDMEIGPGANKIEGTAQDKAGNQAQGSTIAFLGWMLHLKIPYYETTDYYTGAACSQMVLNYLRSGVTDQKTGKLCLELAQEEIYNYGHPFNYEQNTGLAEMDPNAIDYTLGHFDPYDADDPAGQGNEYKGYNFGIESFETAKFTEYLRDIIHWIAYPVKADYWWKEGDVTTWPNVPAIVPAQGKYNHWIVVNGASANENPMPQPYTNPWHTPETLTVYGLWLTDPLSEGIGRDLYVASTELQNTYFSPVESSDQHNGKYIQIAEPPKTPSRSDIDLSQPQTNAETAKVVEIAEDLNHDIPRNLSPFEQRIENLKKHIYDRALAVDLEHDPVNNQPVSEDELLDSVFNTNAKPLELSWQDIIDPYLLTDDNFKKAFDQSCARDFIKVRRIDQENAFYYLIPFDKYQRGEFLTDAAIIIDSQTGAFQQASWTEQPTRFIPINQQAAIEILLAEYPLLLNRDLIAELVWQPDSLSPSPFYPYWRISDGKQVYYITQDREIIAADGDF